MVEMEERQLLEYGVVGIWCRRHDRTTVREMPLVGVKRKPYVEF